MATDTTFRASVTTADDGGLFTYVPLIELHRRLVEFAAATAIDPVDLVQSRLVNTPIPFYPSQWETGRRRWHGVRPEAMWHPLLWVPDDVATRYTVDGQVEDDDSWAVRVCYEVTNRRLFDPATGLWLDLLATVGIDITAPQACGRVAAWLDGGHDPDLDGVTWPDNPLIVETADPDWAYLAAGAVIDALRLSRIATDAEVLAGDLETLCRELENAGEEELDEIAEAISSLFAAAEASFAAAGETELAWWSEVTRGVDEHLDTIRAHPARRRLVLDDGLVGRALERMRHLADSYGERAGQLAATFDA